MVVISYNWQCASAIPKHLADNRKSRNFINIHIILANQSMLSHHDWISGHGWILYFL